jgi:hypothetical protein
VRRLYSFPEALNGIKADEVEEGMGQGGWREGDERKEANKDALGGQASVIK